MKTDIIPSERALIGSVLLDSTILDTLSGRICVSDFYDSQLGMLFSVLVDRNDAGEPVDPVTLLPAAKGIFGETAAATLAELFYEVPNVCNAEYYASQVIEAAKRRKLEVIADNIRDMVDDDSRSADDVAENAVNRLESIGTHESGSVTSAYDAGAELIDSRIIRRGQASEEMMVRMKEANDDLNETPLMIYDKPAPAVQTIRALAKIQKSIGGLDLLVVDYIGLLTPRDRRISRHEQVGEITGMLKQIAKELEVPVIALSQLNREAEGAEPRLSHLRESGSIEQDADIVLFIHRSGKESKLIVGKHRHGDTGSFPITFDAKRTRFF